MDLHGQQLIGFSTSGEGTERFRGRNPDNGAALEPHCVEATTDEIDRALQLAARAHAELKARPRADRAALLEVIASAIEQLGEPLLERAHAETALPMPRLTAERGRTTGQLRMFADVIREGSYLQARIDRPIPDREPFPKPDLRQMQIAVGPVVVFGASNFPFAFSVAGGDTASALAAGCTVVAKAHPAHPGTSEMIGRAVVDAVRDAGLPEGTFSMVQGAGHDVGLALVRHPNTRAVGFTGSLQGGRAIFDAASARPDPIPVFAEMGSINPVFALPGTLGDRAEEIADGLSKSVTMGVGQFCTNPGVVVTLVGDDSTRLAQRLGELLDEAPTGITLHAGIAQSYARAIEERRNIPGLSVRAREEAPADSRAVPTLLTTTADVFLANEELREEVFGPCTVIVQCESSDQMLEVAKQLDGQLTTSVMATADDLEAFGELVSTLEEKVGRLIFNGYPTGLEVCPSTHHGGPYPATTDSRTTSVGSAAISRFLRPICYQDAPSELLPVELADGNPDGILRLVDGEWTRD